MDYLTKPWKEEANARPNSLLFELTEFACEPVGLDEIRHTLRPRATALSLLLKPR